MDFEGKGLYFGETTKEGVPHGRGIVLLAEGILVLRYFRNGICTPGPFINVYTETKTIVQGYRYVRQG